MAVSVRRWFSAVLMAGSIVLSGCGYHLGSEGEVPFSSLTIEPVKNDSFAPQLQADFHAQLSDALARDGSVRVVTSGGRASLTVVFTDYRREIGATDPTDTVVARSFLMTLNAKATLVDASTGKVYFRDRTFRAILPAYSADGGIIRTETQTLPLLSRELAKSISEAVVGVW